MPTFAFYAFLCSISCHLLSCEISCWGPILSSKLCSSRCFPRLVSTQAILRLLLNISAALFLGLLLLATIPALDHLEFSWAATSSQPDFSQSISYETQDVGDTSAESWSSISLSQIRQAPQSRQVSEMDAEQELLVKGKPQSQKSIATSAECWSPQDCQHQQGLSQTFWPFKKYFSISFSVCDQPLIDSFSSTSLPHKKIVSQMQLDVSILNEKWRLLYLENILSSRLHVKVFRV